VLVAAERDEQPVRHELDVLAHQRAVHADEVDRQRLGDELALNRNRLGHDRQQPLAGQLGVQQPARMRAPRVGAPQPCAQQAARTRLHGACVGSASAVRARL